MSIEYEPGHFVGFVRDHGLVQELAKREVGECHFRRHPFFLGGRRDTGEIITGAGRAGLGE